MRCSCTFAGVNVEGRSICCSLAAGSEPIQCIPRILIIEDNSELTLVRDFRGGSGVHLCNAVTEIHAGPIAGLIIPLQRGGAEAFAVSTVAGRLGGRPVDQPLGHARGQADQKRFNDRLAGDGLMPQSTACDPGQGPALRQPHAAGPPGPHCPATSCTNTCWGQIILRVSGKILVRAGAQRRFEADQQVAAAER